MAAQTWHYETSILELQESALVRAKQHKATAELSKELNQRARQGWELLAVSEIPVRTSSGERAASTATVAFFRKSID